MLLRIIIIASAVLATGAYSAQAQVQNDPNPFYAPQTPSTSTNMGLANPAGTAIYVPKQPPHLLGGSPPPTPINPTDNANVTLYPDNAADTSGPTDTSTHH